tara:strand:+ start:581 stop:958 length:378 start_codon:yes stop_codon:yes gene_type:complete
MTMTKTQPETLYNDATIEVPVEIDLSDVSLFKSLQAIVYLDVEVSVEGWTGQYTVANAVCEQTEREIGLPEGWDTDCTGEAVQRNRDVWNAIQSATEDWTIRRWFEAHEDYHQTGCIDNLDNFEE